MSARDLFYSEGKEFSNAEEKAFAREELVYNVTEDVLLLLEDIDVNKKELARRLGKSRSYVTQVLSGARNMTLGSLSDICFSLGVKPSFYFENRNVGSSVFDQVESKWVGLDSAKQLVSTQILIEKSKNVIDCRDHRDWKTQAA